MNIYLVRHGESEGNLKKIHQSENIGLSEKGKKQAQLLAKRLQNINLDAIYTSPYRRAKQTAKIIAESLDIEITYWNKLREQDRPSAIKGLKYSDPKAKKIKKIIRQNQTEADWRFSDDESFNDLLDRAKQVREKLFSSHQQQNVLCVSHVTFIIMMVLEAIFQEKLTPETFWQFYYHSRQKNTGITRIKFTKKFGWNLMNWNDTNHL